MEPVFTTSFPPKRCRHSVSTKRHDLCNKEEEEEEEEEEELWDKERERKDKNRNGGDFWTPCNLKRNRREQMWTNPFLFKLKSKACTVS